MDMDFEDIENNNSPQLPEFDIIEFEKNKNERIEKYSELCNYKSPNIKDVKVDDNTITFQTLRYVGGTPIPSNATFDSQTFKAIKIDNYEKEYIK